MYKCEVCGRKFKSPYALGGHQSRGKCWREEITPNPLKLCAECRTWKPLGGFHGRGHGKLQSKCRDCTNLHSREKTEKAKQLASNHLKTDETYEVLPQGLIAKEDALFRERMLRWFRGVPKEVEDELLQVCNQRTTELIEKDKEADYWKKRYQDMRASMLDNLNKYGD